MGTSAMVGGPDGNGRLKAYISSVEQQTLFGDDATFGSIRHGIKWYNRHIPIRRCLFYGLSFLAAAAVTLTAAGPAIDFNVMGAPVEAIAAPLAALFTAILGFTNARDGWQGYVVGSYELVELWHEWEQARDYALTMPDTDRAIEYLGSKVGEIKRRFTMIIVGETKANMSRMAPGGSSGADSLPSPATPAGDGKPGGGDQAEADAIRGGDSGEKVVEFTAPGTRKADVVG